MPGGQAVGLGMEPLWIQQGNAHHAPETQLQPGDHRRISSHHPFLARCSIRQYPGERRRWQVPELHIGAAAITPLGDQFPQLAIGAELARGCQQQMQAAGRRGRDKGGGSHGQGRCNKTATMKQRNNGSAIPLKCLIPLESLRLRSPSP